MVAWPLVPVPFAINAIAVGGAAARSAADCLITNQLHPGNYPKKDQSPHQAVPEDTRPKAGSDPRLPTIAATTRAMLAFAAVASMLSMHLLIGPVELEPGAERALQAAPARQPSGFD